LALSGLPPANTTRWTARRKAEIVAAVEKNLLCAETARARYGISPEELGEWQRANRCAGLSGLRITRRQHYRGQPSSETMSAAH
jgi:hypothetical protein